MTVVSYNYYIEFDSKCEYLCLIICTVLFNSSKILIEKQL